MMSLFDDQDVKSVVWFARFFQPRTICAMIDDLDGFCERNSKSLKDDQRKYRLLTNLAASLRAYMGRVWSSYRSTPLPIDPYFTVAGRNGDYTAEDYAAEYMAAAQ